MHYKIDEDDVVDDAIDRYDSCATRSATLND